MIRFVFLVTAVFILNSCQTSPTGRRQLAIVPASQLEAMGAQGFDDMKKKMPIEKDPKINAYVKCVGEAIIGVLPEKRDWEIVVFKENSANAFALPGGKIGVHTGMLKVAENSAQLAAVMGHEVAHVLANHAQARVSEQLLIMGGLVVAGEVLNRREGRNYQLLMAALGLGAQVGVMMPNGRAQETESDVMGVEFMAQAGFDPQESVKLWQNMEKASKGAPPEFLSTHPSHGTRIGRLQEEIPKVRPLYVAAKSRPNCDQHRK